MANKSAKVDYNLVPSLVEMAKIQSIPKSLQPLLRDDTLADAVISSISREITEVSRKPAIPLFASNAQVVYADMLIGAISHVEGLRYVLKKGVPEQ